VKNQKRNERNEEPIYGIPGSSRTTGSQQEPIFISDDDIKIKRNLTSPAPPPQKPRNELVANVPAASEPPNVPPDKAKNLVIQAPEPQPPQQQPPQPPARVRGKNGPDRTLPSIPVATIAAVVQQVLLAQIESVPPTFSSRRKRCRMI
jgi:hypothetical protein